MASDEQPETPRIQACRRQCRLANSNGSCTCWRPIDCRFRVPFDPKDFVTGLAFFGDGHLYFPHVEAEIQSIYGG